MVCPYCGGEKTRVERVRTYDEVVFRWRVCQACGMPFSTEELRIDETPHGRGVGKVMKGSASLTVPR
jgi:transcriptional regulator NrdR family protein